MSGANDIANLFARFGGKPEHYQEIARADQARDSESRWPLLSSVGAQAAHPPAVQHGQARTASHSPSPFAQPETAARHDGRTEPTLPWGAATPVLDDAPFSAPLAPVAPTESAPEPAPATAPLSQFIAPRQRGFGRPAPTVRAAAPPAAMAAAAASPQPAAGAMTSTAATPESTAPGAAFTRFAQSASQPTAAPPSAPVAATRAAGHAAPAPSLGGS
ncbi:cellulose biosynthesis protein BcsP, partial [Verticiella alkaliphila]|uniref:cellulose biosynthesis protein BcsP n=1 Tax=Verticiella alkaliphila TaxID=2779529 RepID=UPI001C0B3EEC